MMTRERELLQQALDALDRAISDDRAYIRECKDAAEAIRAHLAAQPAPVPPDEMDAIAIKYAHKLALDLECVLSDYSGRWWDAAVNTIGEYRSAMNAIHERESPTFMGEPVIAASPEQPK